MSRNTSYLLVSVMLAGSAAPDIVRADEQADMLKIVARAIDATGGEAKLAKANARTWTSNGTFYGGGDSREFTARYSANYPKQYKLEIEGFFSMVVNGDKGWTKSQNGTQELPADRLADQKEEMWVSSLSKLLPLKDKDVKLTSAGEKVVDGRPAVGIHVARTGQRDVKLYFDKENGLLVRVENQAKTRDGQLVSQETTYSNFKDVDGIKLATKTVIKRDGSQYIESTLSEQKVLEKLDDSVFGQP